MLVSCAEVSRPTPTASEVEEAQLAAVRRHPFQPWSWERVSRVFLKLLATLPQVHGRTYPFLGFNWWVTESGKIIIDNVWRPSPAHDAGLQQGDLILAVNNWPLHPWMAEWQRTIRATRDVLRDFLWVSPAVTYQDRSRRDYFLPLVIPGELLIGLMLDAQYVAMEARGRYAQGPVTLLVERDGQTRLVTLYPQHLPAEYAVLVDTQGRQLNAYAAPGQVILSVRMVNFCLNDDELALIVGHELAHHAFGHLVRGAGQRRLGGLMGGLWRLVGVLATYPVDRLINLRDFVMVEERRPSVAQNAVVSAFSREDEREADTYGLWFAYQAGYDLDKGLAVFERMGAVMQDPFETTYFLDSHPVPLERLARLKIIARAFQNGQAARIFLSARDEYHFFPK